MTTINIDPNHDAGASFEGLLPKPEGLGIIKSLADLAKKVREVTGNPDAVIQFDAGLPYHERPEQVRKDLEDYAKLLVAGYSRYADGGIKEATVLPSAAAYHERVTGVQTSDKRVVLSEGSTPALNHLIRMLPLQKAKQDGKELGEGCMLETFELSYPLYEIPASHVNMTAKNNRVSKTIKLDAVPTINADAAITSEHWQLNKASLSESFARNRPYLTTFVFSNPANPSGYALSEDEMDFLAGELLQDFQIRRTENRPAKLVIEDIAYITMMHDQGHKPYLLVHAFDKMIAAEAAKNTPDEKLLAQLKACRETVVTVDSLSKAKAVSGDRVAYSEGNPAIISALREAYTQDMLSYSNAALIAAKAAFESTASDEEVMNSYSKRVTALETGMNNAYFTAVSTAGMELTRDQIAETMPFPNKANGTFFTVMNLKPLLGQEVDPAFIAQVKDYVSHIDAGAQTDIGPVFENGRITSKNDLALYFMFKTQELGGTGVSTVPLQDGRVRFAVGLMGVEDIPNAIKDGKDIDRINTAVKSAAAFFATDPVYLKGVREYQPKQKEGAEFHLDLTPETKVQRYTIDISHLAEQGAIARRA